MFIVIPALPPSLSSPKPVRHLSSLKRPAAPCLQRIPLIAVPSTPPQRGAAIPNPSAADASLYAPRQRPPPKRAAIPSPDYAALPPSLTLPSPQPRAVANAPPKRPPTRPQALPLLHLLRPLPAHVFDYQPHTISHDFEGFVCFQYSERVICICVGFQNGKSLHNDRKDMVILGAWQVVGWTDHDCSSTTTTTTSL